MIKKLFFLLMTLCAIIFSCKKNVVSKADVLPAAAAKTMRPLAVTSAPVSTKAPLYRNPYEYNIVHDGYIPETEWQSNIHWVG
jgi:hypothetical protein